MADQQLKRKFRTALGVCVCLYVMTGMARNILPSFVWWSLLIASGTAALVLHWLIYQLKTTEERKPYKYVLALLLLALMVILYIFDY